MVVWNIFFATVFLPLVGIALLGRSRRRPLASWVATLALCSGMVGFSVLAAPWGWFGVPLRIAIALLYVVALVRSLRGARPDEDEAPSPPNPFRLLLMVLIGAFFGVVAIGALRARSVPPGAREVGFPFARGTYLVAQGGSHPAANYHAQEPRERYAVDLMKLNAAGMRARGLYPDDAHAYAIFGDTIVSPCDGTIVAVADAFPDASRISLDEKHPAGNQLTIRCADVDVTFTHLQRGSLAVRAGAAVRRGTPIAARGQLGNVQRTAPAPLRHVRRRGA